MRLTVIAHNIRSTHNIGSIFRTAEGFGIEKLFLTGYSPYPKLKGDSRLPHIAEKLEKQIHKTALGAEKLLPFDHSGNVSEVITDLRKQGYVVAGLEQTPSSVLLPGFTPPEKLALLLGEEVAGISQELWPLCDIFLEIPMHGAKESFNVSVAAGIAIYQLTNVKVTI